MIGSAFPDRGEEKKYRSGGGGQGAHVVNLKLPFLGHERFKRTYNACCVMFGA